jgi:hypothetical protein
MQAKGNEPKLDLVGLPGRKFWQLARQIHRQKGSEGIVRIKNSSLNLTLLLLALFTSVWGAAALIRLGSMAGTTRVIDVVLVGLIGAFFCSNDRLYAAAKSAVFAIGSGTVCAALLMERRTVFSLPILLTAQIPKVQRVAGWRTLSF